MDNLIPGATVTIVNPSSIYYGYEGFVQRLEADKVAILFANYSPWEKMVTFQPKELKGK